MNYHWQNEILNILDANSVSLYDLLLFILRGHLQKPHSYHRSILQHRTSDILDLWSKQFPPEAREWAVTRSHRKCTMMRSIKLIQPHSGFQFRGTNANLEQLEGFSMVEMGKSIKALAPNLWNLLGVLLDADLACERAAPNIGKSPC